MVDLTERGAHSDLVERYGVRGIPRVVYTDPDGIAVKEMTNRDVKSIMKDLVAMISRFPGKKTIWENSLTSALAEGKKKTKPVGLVLVVEDADLGGFDRGFTQALGLRKSKFVWALDVAEKETLKKYELEKGPAVVVLNAETGEVVGKTVLDENGKSEDLDNVLDEATEKK
ncbi:MAG: hypothetical protein HY716_04240 [Planctomycetes bacterium]|nr:hypothetical protein [Planctomycetota bacterium]